MATIGDGWTVISSSETACESKNENDHAENNESNDENKDEASFVPPVATWFDEGHLHFVVLQDTELSESVVEDETTGRINGIDTNSINNSLRRRNFWNQWNQSKHPNSSINDYDDIDNNGDSKNELPKYEFVIYQRMRIPSNLSRHPMSISDESSESLVPDPPLRIALPIQLTQLKKKVMLKNNDKNDEEDYITDIVTTYTSARRAPMLAKFSTNQKYLAIQFSKTCVRIIPTSTSTTVPEEEKQEYSQQHWTIDLNMDAGIPCSCSAHEMPVFTSETADNDPSKNKGKRKSLFGKHSKSDKSITPGTTSLLPGGIIWCPGNKQKQQEQQKNKNEGDDAINNSTRHHDNNEELLLLVTNTGLMIYKVSLANQRFATSKFESIPFHLRNKVSTTVSNLSEAVAFWYEPKGGALLVGSYNRLRNKSAISNDSSFRITDRSSMQIRTFFFHPLLQEKNGSTIVPPLSALDVVTYRHPYSFTFEVGVRSNVKSAEQMIQPEDLAMVNVYGKMFFVELTGTSNYGIVNLYSLGPDCPTHMIRYAPDGLNIERKSHNSVFISVLDNLIVIHARENKKSLYIDVADPLVENCLIVNDSQCFEEGKDDVTKLYDLDNSFLAPSFLLNPKGRGSVSQIKLNLHKLSDRYTWPKRKLNMFFLRRKDPGTESVHLILLKRIRNYFEKNDEISPEIDEFVDQFGVMYGNNDDAIAWDYQACLPFIYKAALLPAAVKKVKQDGKSTYEFSKSGYFMVKPGYNYMEEASGGVQSVLTQSELLQHILLPISYSAALCSDFAKLRIMLNFSISLVGALQQHSVEPCEAIYCLIVALFWRLGDGADIIGFLRSFKFHCTFKRCKAVQNSTSNDEEYALQKELRNTRLEAFAEMLIMIVTTVPFGESLEDANLNGISSLNNSLSYHEDDNPEEEKQIRDSILIDAVDIMCSVSSHRVAARFLLKIGRVNDAISICSKIISDETVLFHRSKTNASPHNQLSFVDQGTSSVDFFKATIYASSNMKGIGERARLFYHLNKFLRRWDPESFEEKKVVPIHFRNSMDGNVNKSNTDTLARSSSQPLVVRSSTTLVSFSQPHKGLVESLGPFPDHLLGGANSPICDEVKKMYGFSTK